jgi:uncharacterized protein (DUF1778 family)
MKRAKPAPDSFVEAELLASAAVEATLRAEKAMERARKLVEEARRLQGEGAAMRKRLWLLEKPPTDTP